MDDEQSLLSFFDIERTEDLAWRSPLMKKKNAALI